MDYQILKNELANDPASLGYAGKTSQEKADILNSRTIAKTKPMMITFRGLYETRNLGPVMAPAVLGKIRARAQANDQVMYDVEKMLYSERGMDIGEPAARLMIDSYVNAGVFTVNEGNALKAIATVHTTRAELLGISAVTADDIDVAEAL